MQDLFLNFKNDHAISIESRSDRAVNVGIGDGKTWAEIIVTDDDLDLIARWLVNYLHEAGEKRKG